MYRNKKYIDFIRSLPSDAPPGRENRQGDKVPAHQRVLGHAGVSLKPPDTYALCLYAAEHAGYPGSEHYGDKTFWGNTNRARKCVEHVCDYLDRIHNIDSWRLALELLTEYMEENEL